MDGTEIQNKIQEGLNATYSNTQTILQQMTFSHTLSQIGLAGDAYITIKNNGTDAVVTVSADETVQDLIDKLAVYGINSTLLADGKLMLSGNMNQYIYSMSDTLANALHFNVGEGYTYKVSYGNANSDSTQFGNIEYGTITNSSTLNHSGLGSNGYITIVTNNTEYVVTVAPDKTISQIFNELNGYGISTELEGGKVTLSGSKDAYIKGISANAANVLHLKAGEGFTYEIEEAQSYSNDSSDVLQKLEVTNVTGNTVISDIDGYDNGNGKILVHRDNGQFVTVTIDETQTLNEFFQSLEQYGLVGTIENGIATITGVNNVYLQAVAGGSNLLTSLNMGNLQTTVKTISVGKTDTLVETITTTASATSQLQGLMYEDGTALTFNGDNIELTLETKTASGSNKYTLMFSKTSTLSDVVNNLRAFGITASVSGNGQIFLESNNLNDYTLGGALGEFIIGSGIKTTIEGATTSVSKPLIQTDDAYISDETKLADIGITNGNFIIYQEGAEYTVNTNGLSTIGDFRQYLELYGFSSFIDSQGKLSIMGYGDTYLKSADGGSNILEVLGLNSWTQNNLSQTSKDLTDVVVSTGNALWNTKLSELRDSAGNLLGITGGNLFVYQDGEKKLINIDTDKTIGDLAQELLNYDISLQLNNGTLYLESLGNSYVTSEGLQYSSNLLDKLGIGGWNEDIEYNTGSVLNITTSNTVNKEATKDTLLSDLGITTGEYYIYNNGVKYTAIIDSDDTLGSFTEDLERFGLQTAIMDGKVTVLGNGNSYITKSNNSANASNIMDLFTQKETTYNYNSLQQTAEKQTVTIKPTESDLIKDFAPETYGANAGILTVTVDGKINRIEVDEDETFAGLIEKLNSTGITASFNDGNIVIQSLGKDFEIVQTSSHVLSNLGMIYSDNLGNFAQSSEEVESTTKREEIVTQSAANWADESTKMGLLNISDGDLSIFVNGQKFKIQINSDETFSTLKARLASASPNLTLDFKNGYLEIYSTNPDESVEVGSTTDSTNFVSITGVASDGTGKAVSGRELYRVNETSRIMEEGLFRAGNVAAGVVEIGNAQFTIDENTTIADFISQINANEDANATAYWDNIQGRLVIQSRTSGSAVINISSISTEDALDSNNKQKLAFTDVLGYTVTELNNKGVEVNKLVTDAQTLGQNARFKINGTSYTSTSNRITSDISRIEGLTFDLKGVTEEGGVTITVEKDSESIATAVEDVVNAYNELITNVDEAIATDGELHDQTTLKLIRNQIRNLMIGSVSDNLTYKNLNSIGICIEAASANNISTSNISNLTFDRDKFISAFEDDSNAVKTLLVGNDTFNGIFSNVENIVENSLKAATGYFDSADNSYTYKINTLGRKIESANASVERYRAMLERKFANMDYTIGRIQQQYSSFLS